MKNLSLLLLFACFLFSCSQNKVGELVNAPDGMKEAVAEFVTASDGKLKEMSVRQYPQNVYLVTATYELNKPLYGLKINSFDLLVQKSTNNTWNVSIADKERQKMFGIN